MKGELVPVRSDIALVGDTLTDPPAKDRVAEAVAAAAAAFSLDSVLNFRKLLVLTTPAIAVGIANIAAEAPAADVGEGGCS